jgi:hypothetical protein
MKEDEVAIDTVTGEWHWWDPDTVEQKGASRPAFAGCASYPGARYFAS